VGIHKIDGPFTAEQAKNYLLIKVCVSLESRPHVRGAWRPVPGCLQLRIKRWMLAPGFVSHTRELGPSIQQVGNNSSAAACLGPAAYQEQTKPPT